MRRIKLVSPPFGMVMPGRSNSSSAYRFGFNGKENDNEVKGIGNTVSFEARVYDPRLGKFLSCDPLEKNYPWQTPYAYFMNSPASKLDYLGMGDYYTKNGKHLGSDGKKVKDKNGKLVPDNKAYIAEGLITDKGGKKTFTNAVELPISNSELTDIASTVADESSGKMEESYGIASVIFNGSKDLKMSRTTWMKNYTSNYSGKEGYGSLSDNEEFSMGAAINATIGGFDYSGGAIKWDGVDLAEYGFNQYKGRTAGFNISEEHFNLFKAAWSGNAVTLNRGRPGTFSNNFSPGLRLANNGERYAGMCLYTSLAVHGQTLFWGKNKTDFYYTGKPQINGIRSDAGCITIDKFYPNKGFNGAW